MRNLTPQTQPCTCVCIYKANISCLIYDILYLRAIFVPLTYFTGQTVTVLKVNQFLCSEVSDVYIPNAVISILHHNINLTVTPYPDNFLLYFQYVLQSLSRQERVSYSPEISD